ncbi:DNA translocase FtsK [Parvularcula lutaonensis]|uniref:DNA translocase FtsK n=1 Tax=Parvularcula lutaonensis TaxID=491923 RepID=A0ABV7MB44_9PROT|nr:DNA translocase FtsK [Parvularcula lutaonensis]
MPRRKSAQKPDPKEQLRVAVRRLVARSGGAALIFAAIFSVLSIASFDISDPSWSTATGREGVENVGGPLGAILSDFLLQAMGGAAIPALLVLMLWGLDAVLYGTPEKTPVTGWLKALALPLGTVAAAGAMAAWPRPADWPFIVGVGGLFGDGALGLLQAGLSAIFVPFPRMVAATLLSVSAVVALAFAGGTRWAHVIAASDAVVYSYQTVAEWIGNLVSRLRDRGPAEEEDEHEPLKEPGPLVRLVDEEPLPAEGAVEPDDAAAGTAPAPVRKPAAPKEPRIKREVRKVPPKKRPQVRKPGDAYEFPGVHLLKAPSAKDRKVLADSDLEERARMLERVLADFKIGGEIIGVRPGPVVTLYELEPAAGVKSSRVIGLADDIARSMSAVACRVAVVPGRNAIGIELPNDDREMVYFREMLSTDEFVDGKNLTLALGKDIGGQPQYADLSKMPHLLIAGTTGSGKSVGINTMILSLLYRLPPEECKMIMVDPKMLELSVYEGIPHLLAPVVTDPRKAVVALKWTVREMEERYKRMSKVGVRNIHGFNERVTEAKISGEPLVRKIHSGYDPETGEPTYEEEILDEDKMPFIVVVIDEVADLMMVAGKDIEAMVQRLAQMARAAGIHLIMATQRPSVDVITGTIKANFPTRISFQVTSKIDSRTILGEQGAEQLLGQGDMLYMAGGGRITRVHGAFVADGEVEKIVDHLKSQGKPDYIQEVTEGDEEDGEIAAQLGLDIGGNTGSGDALFDQAVAIVVRDRKASTSYLQRRLQIGYNRAATLIEKLEDEGIISQANHAGKREILIGEDAA